MQHQIGFRRFFERGAKCRDERMRQPVDEPDGVRQQQLAADRAASRWRTSGSRVTNSAFDATASASSDG